jgi:sialate O-acetylesterase
VLRFDGDNVIAIRVFDEGGAGGIVGNRIGFFIKENDPIFAVSLAGNWKFQTGDKGGFRKPGYDDSDWRNIMVPALWESQGVHNYDGLAWYRKSFRMPEELMSDEMVLVLGKIDDFDEVFLNGKHIGSTGRMGKRVGPDRFDDAYRKLRIYYIPEELVRTDREGGVAVRVYDGWQHGGIYEGPIGIITARNLRNWLRETQQTSILTRFLQIFFE